MSFWGHFLKLWKMSQNLDNFLVLNQLRCFFIRRGCVIHWLTNCHRFALFTALSEAQRQLRRSFIAVVEIINAAINVIFVIAK